jgi:hypothetical protein
VLALLLVLACLAVLLVRVGISDRDDGGERLEVGLRGTSILFVTDCSPDELTNGKYAVRYALYDWKFRLRLEAVWTIHGFALTVCQ